MHPEDLRILIADTKDLLDEVDEAAESEEDEQVIDTLYHEVEAFERRLKAVMGRPNSPLQARPRPIQRK